MLSSLQPRHVDSRMFLGLVRFRNQIRTFRLKLGLVTLASLQKIVTTFTELKKQMTSQKKARILTSQNCFSSISRGALLPMTCPVCNQETELGGAEYCLAHHRAFENIRQAFEKWTVAYGNLTPPDFLQRVQKAPRIGPKAKEIALFLVENSSRWK